MANDFRVIQNSGISLLNFDSGTEVKVECEQQNAD